MTEQLQSLIDRIQSEALEKAKEQSARMIAEAESKAAAIVRGAEEKAQAIVQRAQQEAEGSNERGRRALAQAARDVRIKVEQEVDGIVARIVTRTVDEVLGPEVVSEMLVKMAEAYAALGGEEGRLEAWVSPQDQERIVAFFEQRYRGELEKGIDIRVDPDLEKGFQVSFGDETVRHDFGGEAVSEALAAFLRPRLAAVVRGTDNRGGPPEGESAP